MDIFSFSSFLSIEQVLYLWDRIIAYDSLELIFILSAAIFIYREKSILQSKNIIELKDSFNEMYSIEVIPLLQLALFSSLQQEE